MNEAKHKHTVVAGAASEIGKDHPTERFMRYPVMPTVTPQLVRVNLYDVRLRGAWGGRRAVHDPHVGCPVAALPVVRVLEGRQHLWDMTLSDGEVVHDYLKPERR